MRPSKIKPIAPKVFRVGRNASVEERQQLLVRIEKMESDHRRNKRNDNITTAAFYTLLFIGLVIVLSVVL